MSLTADVRFALRLLRRSPSTTAIAVFSIALSVGATAVVFAAIKSVLIDPLPIVRPDELVLLRADYPHMQQQSLGDWLFFNDAKEIERRSQTLEAVGTINNSVFDIAGEGGAPPEAHYGVRVDANVFPILGVSPMLGRNITPEEDQPGKPRVVILSYGLWRQRFHMDRAIVGRNITVGGHDCLVIGVMPRGFNFPLRREAAHTPAPYVEFWTAPMTKAPLPAGTTQAVSRLRPGVTIDQARQDVAAISRALTRDFPALNRDRELSVNLLRDRVLGSAPKSLMMLMAAAGLFMLVGCANVANLLLARGFARQREMAVRAAVGAGFGRILRQLLTESCVLALAGGLSGYALTALAWRLLPAIAPTSIPRLADAHADTAVLWFALTLAVVTGVLFGIAPALRLALQQRRALWSGFNVRGADGGGRDRLRAALIASEVAVSVVLVVAGTQVVSAFVQLIATDPGFEADHVLGSVLLAAPERYPIGSEKREVFYQRAIDTARAIPGVESAAVVDALPFSGENHGGAVNAAGGAAFSAEVDVAGGDYAQALGLRLVEGRWFRADEMAASNKSAVISSSVARRLWPSRNAIGQSICIFCTPENPNNWKQVIGVVAGAAHTSLDTKELGNVYLAAGALGTAQFLVVRTSRPSGEMIPAIRRAIAAIDPNQPVFLSATMRELISDSTAARRFVVVLLAITSCLALMLSAAGIYGVVSYTTSRRTQEIGIRMALGATPRNIIAVIFQQGFATVGVGAAIGLAAAALATAYLQSVIPGLGTGHAGSAGIAVALVMLTAGVACLVPARRATKTDPLVALRQE